MKKEKNKQIEKGIEVEKEHIDTIEKIASGEIKPEDAPKAIAEDHLDEDKKYYDKLEDVENKTENINSSKEDYDKKKDEITDAIKQFKANFIINSLIGELGEIVNMNPNLFSDYVSFCMSLQKKYRPYFDIYDKEFGMPKVVQWLDENKKTIFDVIELKDYSLPKYKSFSTIPEDKIFMDIHSKFASKDSLRLKFLGTNFSEKGVVTTNAKILLFTKYRGSETNLGNYCNTKICFENESEVKSQGYVDYQSIVPREGERIEVKSEALYDYLRNVDNYRLYDKIQHSVHILLKDEFFYFNTDYLIESLETMSKLGHNHLEISYSRQNRAVMICPRGRVNDCENLQADFIIIMPILNYEENSYGYDLDKNCYIDDSKNEYCFDGEVKEKIKLKNKVEELEKTIEVLKSTKKVDDKKEDEEIIEIKDDTKSKNVDLEEISGALETLKMLVEVGGTDDEIKEWKEAIETLEILQNLNYVDEKKDKKFITKEEEKETQQKKANELREILLKEGFKVSQPNTSITNFGVSTYIGFYDDYNVYRKFRISDHSVTNTDRIFNEYHYGFQSNLHKLVDLVKKNIEETKEIVEKRKETYRLEDEKNKKLDKKWDLIKHKFEGLCFKKNERTYQDLNEFSKNKNRSNIYQRLIEKNKFGEIAYYYEWTEPKNPNELCKEKPSMEYIEQYNIEK